MIVLDYIKKFFNIFKSQKLLPENTENIDNDDNVILDIEDAFEKVEKYENTFYENNNFQSFYNEKLKSEKIQDIIEELLGGKNITNKIGNYNEVNVKQLRELLKYLFTLKYSKKQICRMIEKNPDILFMNKNDFKLKFYECAKCLENVELTKQLITNNSSVLSENIKLSIDRLVLLLKQESFTRKEINELIENTPTIFSVSENNLKASINAFKNLFGEEYKKKIIENSDVIGASDKKIILSYISEMS